MDRAEIEKRARDLILWMYDLDREDDYSHGRYQTFQDRIVKELTKTHNQAIEECIGKIQEEKYTVPETEMQKIWNKGMEEITTELEKLEVGEE